MRATKLGRYPSRAIASSTFRRVAGRMCGYSFTTLETVFTETPASTATSFNRAGGRAASFTSVRYSVSTSDSRVDIAHTVWITGGRQALQLALQRCRKPKPPGVRASLLLRKESHDPILHVRVIKSKELSGHLTRCCRHRGAGRVRRRRFGRPAGAAAIGSWRRRRERIR